MTERFYPPVFKFTTATLKTLPLAQLKFFETGTTTAKAVYADKYKVTSFGATVVADSAGNFPPIFLDGTYRVSLLSSVASGSVVQTGWPVDNVGGDYAASFGEWNASATYANRDLVSENTIYGIQRYESLASNNLNFRPSANPLKWRRIYFSTVSVSAGGSEVSSTGAATNTATIVNGQQLKIQLGDEKNTGILNILANIPSVGFASASVFVTIVDNLHILYGATQFVIGSSPASTKIGLYSDGNRSIYVKNNTGVTITCTINIQGAEVVGLTDNA